MTLNEHSCTDECRCWYVGKQDAIDDILALIDQGETITDIHNHLRREKDAVLKGQQQWNAAYKGKR